MKTKAFDCVEMKNHIQLKLLEEYKGYKKGTGSYVDFINATAEADSRIEAFRKKISGFTVKERNKQKVQKG